MRSQSLLCKATNHIPERRGPSALNQGALVVRYLGTSIRSIRLSPYSTLPKLSAPIPTRWERAKWPHLRGPSLIAGRHVFPMEASGQSQSSSSALGEMRPQIIGVRSFVYGSYDVGCVSSCWQSLFPLKPARIRRFLDEILPTTPSPRLDGALGAPQTARDPRRAQRACSCQIWRHQHHR